MALVVVVTVKWYGSSKTLIRESTASFPTPDGPESIKRMGGCTSL